VLINDVLNSLIYVIRNVTYPYLVKNISKFNQIAKTNVTLDKKRNDIYGMPVGKIRIYGHPHDLVVASKIAKGCEKVLREMGAEDIYSSISSIPPQNLIAGGCRFGNDPKKSVLNPFCQSHDLANLFVVDASFMPTGGSVPYTWTIYAGVKMEM